MPRIKPIVANDDGWTEWQAPTRRYRMACCDCGLVHNVEFCVVLVGRKRSDGTRPIRRYNPAGYRVMFRMKRNERSTSQVHRHSSGHDGGPLRPHGT
jgi:hypothetical protein